MTNLNRNFMQYKRSYLTIAPFKRGYKRKGFYLKTAQILLLMENSKISVLLSPSKDIIALETGDGSLKFDV